MSASGFSMNKDTDSITSVGTLVPVGAANPLHIFDEKTFIAIATVTVLSFTSVDDDTRIRVINCTSNTHGLYTLKIDGGVIDRLRSDTFTGNNARFDFGEPQELLLNETLTVEYLPERLLAFIGTGEVSSSISGFLQ